MRRLLSLFVAALVGGCLLVVALSGEGFAQEEYVPYNPTNPYVPTQYFIENPQEAFDDDGAPVLHIQNEVPGRVPAIAYGGPFSLEVVRATQAGALGFGGVVAPAETPVGASELAFTGATTQMAISLAFLLIAGGGAALIGSRDRRLESA